MKTDRVPLCSLHILHVCVCIAYEECYILRVTCHMTIYLLHIKFCSHFHHLIVVFRLVFYCLFCYLYNLFRLILVNLKISDILVSKMIFYIRTVDYLIVNVIKYFPSWWKGTPTPFPFAINETVWNSILFRIIEKSSMGIVEFQILNSGNRSWTIASQTIQKYRE